MTYPKLVAVAEFGQVMLDAYRTQASFALEPNATDRLEALEDAITHLKHYIATQAKLSCQYAPLAWKELDADELGNAWTQANDTWWPKSFFAKRQVLKRLRAGGAQGEPDPGNDIAVLRELREIGSHIDRLDDVLQ